MRHLQQGPMRSEKVYMTTKVIHEKVEQLAQEKFKIK
jgi:hypothetical protein